LIPVLAFAARDPRDAKARGAKLTGDPLVHLATKHVLRARRAVSMSIGTQARKVEDRIDKSWGKVLDAGIACDKSIY